MGCCSPAQFKASFSANLRELFDYYRKTALFIKSQQLFATRSSRLQTIVDTYLQNPRAFNTADAELCAVDTAHKLHPVDYVTSKITRQWLIQACLRQHKFINEFPFQILNFEDSYKEYVEFLYTCVDNSHTVIVPNKLADFMWHSHMQDNRRYKADSQRMLGRVLDHLDDLSQSQMRQYEKYTDQYRKKVFQPNKIKGSGYPQQDNIRSYAYQYLFIDYGQTYQQINDQPQTNPRDQRQSQHSKHHHHPQKHHPQKHHINEQCEKPIENHHHHHNNPTANSATEGVQPVCVQSNHHHPSPAVVHTHHHSSCGGYQPTTTVAHSSYGGGHHSSYGGGHHSSCGGGHHSSCGGGHSSCGGAASSCGGGGASSCGGN